MFFSEGDFFVKEREIIKYLGFHLIKSILFDSSSSSRLLFFSPSVKLRFDCLLDSNYLGFLCRFFLMLGIASCIDSATPISNTLNAIPSNLENSPSESCDVFYHYPHRGFDGCRNGVGGRGLLKASLFNHSKNQQYKGV